MIEEILQFMERSPFRPFALQLTSGEVVPVNEQKEIALHPHDQKTVIVFEAAGTHHIINLSEIASLQVA